eukprot:Em0003g656a
MIYRWSPSSADSTAVISLDLHQPTSVAVDWSGNNIYFTHRIGENGPSRIEVVSADGRSRRVIVAPLPYTNSADYMYLAFSVSTGRLYYTYNQQIFAVDADGQNPTEIYTSLCPTPVVTLALDPLAGTLYWTDCTTSTIRWMDTSNTSLRGNFSLPPTSSPVWIAALNNSFYWTQQVGGGGGYVYRVDQPRSGQTVTPVCVWNSSSITPSAVRVLVDGFICPQQGCAVRNGGCGSLCLTTPTGPSCTCPTGRVINNNNSCPLHPRNFILFSKNFVSRSEIRILSFDLGESPPFPEIDYLVPITVANANANYVSYDVVTNRVYWIEQGAQATPTIKRAYLDGTGLEVFINTSISDPRNLAVDPSSRNLYWVDTDFDAVMVASLNNPTLRTILLVTPDSQPPIGIDLDVTRGTSYPNLPCYTSPCTDICLTDNATPETATCSCPAYRTLLPPMNTACSGLQCSGVNQFLCSDRSACIPLGYFCDGIDHCRDASDELSPNCPCSTDKGTKLCSNGSMECRPRSVFCDGHKNCLYGEDESPLQCGCLDPSKFQCYLGGVLQCLYNLKKCDGMPDCDDKSDELNCPTSSSTTTVTSTNNGQSVTPLSASTYIVISVALVIVIVLVGAAVTWCITSCVLHRRKYYSRTQPQKVEQLSMMNGRVSCISPQQRSDSTSQYSGTSMGTHSTLLAGMHADGASGVKRCTSIDLDNPPPSPITMHRYDLPIGPENGENVSTISQLMPAVPNPSMNFSVADGISDGMSISVSQRNFPVNGPTVHYRRVPGSVYSNGTTLYAPPPSAYQNKYQREPVHFRRDADARSISTISSSTLGTENPEQYAMYDDMMEHDAPPPSPVTELSIPQYTFPANSPSSTSGYLESQF